MDEPHRSRWHRPLAIALLSALTVVVYFPIHRHAFINFDDAGYIFENQNVTAGLSWAGLRWAFTTFEQGNWHPLTWISHQIDCQLFGVEAGSHLMMNLGLHLVCVGLVFGIFHRMTGAFGRSLFVAASFALHPINIQTVAWAAEKKNTLSTVFWLLAIAFHHAYAVRPSLGRYALVLLAFACGLLSKPMVVTLPFVLLLLDYWPLARTDRVRAIVEKLPLIAMTLASSWVTYVAQGITTRGHVRAPFLDRMANALNSYVAYLKMMIWPFDFALEYPWHPIPPAIAIGAACFVAIVSCCAVVFARRLPYLFVGWFWYLGTLVPVIGIVQVGRQAMADRYAYLPLIGIFVVIAWGASDLIEKLGARARATVVGIAIALLAILGVRTRQELVHWRDDLAIFSRALELTEGNFLMENCVGNALERRGELDRALDHYIASIQIHQGWWRAYEGPLSVLRKKAGDRTSLDAAIERYTSALPELVQVRTDVAALFAEQGRMDDAHREHGVALGILRERIAREPKVETLLELIRLLLDGPYPSLLNPDEATQLAEQCLELDAENEACLQELIRAYRRSGHPDRATEVTRRLQALIRSRHSR